MNKPQKRAFWSIYISFCVVATIFLHMQGAFSYQGMAAEVILVASFLVVGFFIYLYVKNNAAQIEKWFE